MMGNRTFNCSKQIASLMAVLFTLVSFTSTASMTMLGGGDESGYGHTLHQHHENSAQPHSSEKSSPKHCKMSSSAHKMSCENMSHQSNGHDPAGCQLLCAISSTPSILSLSSPVTPCRSLIGTVRTLLPQDLPSTLVPPPFKPPRLST